MSFDAGSIKGILNLDVNPFKKGIKDSENAAQGMGANLSQKITAIATSFTAITQAVSIVKNAIMGIVSTLGDWAAASGEQEKLNIRLSNTLKNLGQYTEETNKDILDFCDAIHSLTGMEDEDIEAISISMLNMNVPVDQLKDAVTAALNLSEAMGIDLDTAVTQLSRTLGGNADRLARIIPELKTLTEEELKSGRAIDIVNTKFAGFTEALQGSYSVQLKKLSSNWSDLTQALGDALTTGSLLQGVMAALNDVIDSLTKYINNNRAAIADWAKAFLVNFVAAIQTAIVVIGKFVKGYMLVMGALNEARLKGAKDFYDYEVKRWKEAEAKYRAGFGSKADFDAAGQAVFEANASMQKLEAGSNKMAANMLAWEQSIESGTAYVGKFLDSANAYADAFARIQAKNAGGAAADPITGSKKKKEDGDKSAEEAAVMRITEWYKEYYKWVERLAAFRDLEAQKVALRAAEELRADEEHMARMEALSNVGGALFGGSELIGLTADQIARVNEQMDAWNQLNEQWVTSFEVVIAELFHFESASQSVVAVVSGSMTMLKGVVNASGKAWEQMLLTGEISAKTFGEAMKAGVAQELAALSASSVVSALYATAVGFLKLAQHDFAGATSAFTAAAGFAAVAAVSGVAAAALSKGSNKGGGAAETASGGSDSSGGGGGGFAGAEKANSQRYLHLEIHGNIFGQEEYIREQFLPALNSLVMEDDAVIMSSSRASFARTQK